MQQAGAVFTQTNEVANRVLAFSRDAEGRLGEPVAYETGGAGTATPHLPSQGSVVLSGDGRFLLVANAGSSHVSVFRLEGSRLDRVGVVDAGGDAPRSVAERGGVVYVLNTGKPAIASFRLAEDPDAMMIDAGTPMSSTDADPAQIGIAPDGTHIVVTSRGDDAIGIIPIEVDGSLGEPRSVPSSGPTPYGFAFASNGTLVVTEAFRAERGAAAASSYVLRDGTLRPVTRSLGNGMSEICWAVVAPDDRFAFTTNFAESTVSRFSIGADGDLTLEDATAGSVGMTRSGLRDEDVSADGRFLYAIDADGGSLVGWSIGDGGVLTPTMPRAGLPNTIAGLAVV